MKECKNDPKLVDYVSQSSAENAQLYRDINSLKEMIDSFRSLINTLISK